MKNVINLYSFIFVRKALRDLYPHATKWQCFKYHMRNGVRHMLVLATLAIIIGSAGMGARYFYPLTVQAEPVIQRVPAEVTLADFPILTKICKAESGGKQFLTNGNIVRGKANHSDIGICQINESINNDQARKLGFDIFTEKGNVQMAIWMFVNQGTQPWISSMCITNGWGTPAQCANK